MCQYDTAKATSDKDERPLSELARISAQGRLQGIETHTLCMPDILDPFRELPSIVQDGVNSMT